MFNLCRFHLKCVGVNLLRQNCLKDVARIISSSSAGAQKLTEAQPPLGDNSGRFAPLIAQRELKYLPQNRAPLQAWVESMAATERDKVGLFDLHPSIFGTFPRIDVLWWNIHWQRMYQYVNYEVVKTRAELPGGGRKPWPQKGTGRARHGSRNSPLFKGGGKSFGPRGPKSYFYMLSKSKRILGLRVALSCKYAQDNLYVVDSLDIPSDEPQFLEDLVESRGWGLSVLFVDTLDVLPRNFALAIDKIPQYNAMPVYGLNVYSMLKHETLVLTTRAVEAIEDRLLFHMNHVDSKDKKVQANLFLVAALTTVARNLGNWPILCARVSGHYM